MDSLETTYMGLHLRNPVIAGASSLTSNVTTIKALEQAGAGAVVISSLFEEQIQLERLQLDEELAEFDNLHPEMVTIFPHIEHAGPQEHLMWVRRATEAVGIPVIASLNAVNRETWVKYAKLLQETGVDGLELNFYATPTDLTRDGASIEDEQVAIAADVRQAISIPFAVKLSPFYANPLHVVSRLDAEGVDGFVLFNRFFQPEIDVSQERHISPLRLSNEGDYGLSLRFAGLLFGNVTGDICSSAGIFTGEDAIKTILAGATCVQVVSTLYRNRIPYLTSMLETIEGWMAEKGYGALEDFRGKLSRAQAPDRWAYTRAQYVKLLLKPELLRRQRSA